MLLHIFTDTKMDMHFIVIALVYIEFKNANRYTLDAKIDNMKAAVVVSVLNRNFKDASNKNVLYLL